MKWNIDDLPVFVALCETQGAHPGALPGVKHAARRSVCDRVTATSPPDGEASDDGSWSL